VGGPVILPIERTAELPGARRSERCDALLTGGPHEAVDASSQLASRSSVACWYLAEAEAHLTRREEAIEAARRREREASADLAAERQRWRPRREVLNDAHSRLARARGDIERWGEDHVTAKAKVAGLRAAVDEHTRVLAQAADRQASLRADLGDLDRALDATRTERVHAIANGNARGDHLRSVLGDAPADAAQRAVWCDLALRAEPALDDPERRSRLRWAKDPIDKLVGGLLDGRQDAVMAARALVTNPPARTRPIAVTGPARGIEHPSAAQHGAPAQGDDFGIGL
jgi:hypothetical protein